MVRYRGNKRAIGPKIANVIREMSNAFDINTMIYDCCAGSGEFTAAWGINTVMVDSGPWGIYWRAVHFIKHNICNNNPALIRDMVAKLKFGSNLEMERTCRTALVNLVPTEAENFVRTFIALQGDAFNGKSVEITGSWFKHPGFERRWNSTMINSALERSFRIVGRTVHHKDIFEVNYEPRSIIYVDPPYPGTSGYGDREVDIARFLHKVPDCDVYVSNHEDIPSIPWTAVFTVTNPESQGRVARGCSIVADEYLFFRRRTETAVDQTSAVYKPNFLE